MAKISLPALQGFLRKPDPLVGAVLVYGSDPTDVTETARRIVVSFGVKPDDAFAVARLSEQDLAADPGRLVDEVQSLPFFADRRVIWIGDAGAQFLKDISGVLAGQVAGNMVVAEAGNLARGAPLRSAFEESRHGLILPLYEAGEAGATVQLEALLAERRLKLAQADMALLVERAGYSAALLRNEVEKLYCFTGGGGEIAAADLKDLGGDSFSDDVDGLADAVLGGDVGDVDRLLSRLLRSGSDAGRILSSLLAQVARLIELRQKVDRGMRPIDAIKAARPPIFFTRQERFVSLLQVWSNGNLLRAATSIAGAIGQARMTPGLAPSLAGRALLAIARNARAARAQRV